MAFAVIKLCIYNKLQFHSELMVQILLSWNTVVHWVRVSRLTLHRLHLIRATLTGTLHFSTWRHLKSSCARLSRMQNMNASSATNRSNIDCSRSSLLCKCALQMQLCNIADCVVWLPCRIRFSVYSRVIGRRSVVKCQLMQKTSALRTRRGNAA